MLEVFIGRSWVQRSLTYSPPVTLLVPKLLPTTPVQRHVFPAAFFQVAVAVAPTLRHVTARFSRCSGSTGELDVRAAAVARNVKMMDRIVDIRVVR